MWRLPARCAAFTWISASASRSSTTIGSGSVASSRANARNARSTAATAMASGILSRIASSGTTRMSVGENPLQTPLRLGQRLLEVLQLLAVAEPLEPLLQHREIRLENPPRPLQQLLAHQRVEGDAR